MPPARVEHSEYSAHDEASSGHDGGAAMAVTEDNGEALSWRLAPLDILLRIFTLLSGDTLALCAVAGVCATWRTAVIAAQSSPALWRELRVTCYRALQRLDDAAVACVTERAKGLLQRVQLDGAARITDACLACFAPRAAPLLATLRLAGCERITARAVVKQRRRAPRLARLTLAGTAPNLGRLSGDDALLNSLRALVVADDEDADVDDDEEFAGALDVVAVCAHHETGRPRCGRLLGEDDCEECSFCARWFCESADERFAPHVHACARCDVRACEGCLAEALASEYGDADLDARGHVCSYCRQMLCGSCAAEYQEEHSQLMHFQCGACKKCFCASAEVCKYDSSKQPQCADSGCCCGNGAYARKSPDECLRFVCTACAFPYPYDIEPSLIMCTNCSMPYCRLCVDDGMLERTGRVTEDWFDEALCGSCIKRRSDGRQRR